MDRLSQVMAALIGSSSAEATAPALSPPSKTEDRARTAPTVSRDEASSAHQAEVSQQVVAQLRKERQQLREQLQQAAHLMADVRQRLSKTRQDYAKGHFRDMFNFPVIFCYYFSEGQHGQGRLGQQSTEDRSAASVAQ